MASARSSSASSAGATPARPARSAAQRAALLGVWLAVAISAIVFAEPAPVDFLLMALVVVLPLLGVAPVSKPLVPYLVLWLVVTATGCISTLAAFDMSLASKHVFVTFYLSMASVVLAAFVEQAPGQRVQLIMSAYMVAAVVATLAALVGYFNIAPSLSELLTEFGRARGTFKDPNVYGAFVVPALVFALHLGFSRGGLRGLLAFAVAGLLLLGVLVSFSRGAWSNTALSLAVYLYLSFVTARSHRQRFRLAGLVVAAGLCGAGLLAVALQSEAVSNLLSERAQVAQDYDVGPNGRFGGHEKAKALILEHPFGIGPLQFAHNYHNEDVHEVYYNVTLGHGWLGGAAYSVIVIMSLIIGWIAALRPTGLQPATIAVLASYVGTVGEGFVVDTDHWRHFFLLLSLLWGLYLGTRPSTKLPARALRPALPAMAPAAA